MSTAAAARPTSPTERGRPSRDRLTVRLVGLLAALVLLALLVLLSVVVGTKSIPPDQVAAALFHHGGHGPESDNAVVVRTLRVPRTVLGLAVGAAIGLAGALMQALTRNPLADPGLLGVDAGAAAAVVTAIGVLGLTSPSAYVWFALVGAAVASVVVYLLGSSGHAAATPVRLALAGAAIGAALTSYVTALSLNDPLTFQSFRFWTVGSLDGRPIQALGDVAPFLVLGAVVALALTPALNVLALGDDAGRSLGAHLGRTRVLGILAITLLAGGATAAAGPIAFLGLAVPHAARAVTGPDQRWILPYSMVLAAIVLLAADIVGRIVARPGEIEVGIVTAFVGAPVLILLARRSRLAQL